MARPTVAILDDQLPTKLRAEPGELDGIDIVWTGQSLHALAEVLPTLRPQVLVLQLDYLGGDPLGTVQDLTKLGVAELTIVTYAFARRDVLKDLQQRAAVRPLRSPVTPQALRAQLTSVIVRSLMTEGGTGEHASVAEIRTPRFSPSQLAKLESITTSVSCECPRHLSTLLSSLVYFEAYCKECEHRSDEDAQVHRMLYERSARARMLLEDGLERVLEHEDIRV